MPISPIAQSPVARAFLRTLLFTVSIEAIFHRLLTIPAESEAWPWLARLHESTGQAGEMMFVIAFTLLVPTLLGVAYAALRLPAWPGAANSVASIGALALIAMWVSGVLTPRGPIFAIAFGVLSLVVCLAMLAGMYETCGQAAGRAFAVALAGSLLCMTAANASDLAALVSSPWLAPRMSEALSGAGIWLLFAAGALAFATFAPPPAESGGAAGRTASLGLSAASAFALIVGTVTHAPLLSRLATSLGADAISSPALVLRTGAAAAALFLVLLTGFRCLGRPESRTRAYGLLFLLLAGHPHRIAYEHMLAVLGVALVSASPPPPARSPSIELRFEEIPPRDV